MCAPRARHYCYSNIQAVLPASSHGVVIPIVKELSLLCFLSSYSSGCKPSRGKSLNHLLYAWDYGGDELQKEDEVAAKKHCSQHSITQCGTHPQGVEKDETHLSTLNSFPPASAIAPSFFMTAACLQGWIEAETTEVCGKGSTVIVFLACSSLTSSKICNRKQAQLPNACCHEHSTLPSPEKRAQVPDLDLLWFERLPGFIVPNQPESRHLVVFIVGYHEVICPCM